MLINKASLSETVDAINAAHFDGRTLAAAERGEAARWIAARQGLPAAYAGTFAGFPPECSRGIVLFTGERITSASARHILGEEASRAPPRTRATAILVSSVAANAASACGATCSQAAWIAHDERLRGGASHLRSMRDGEHQWRRFPFWYTVLALSEMDNAEARTELRYAAPALERAAGRAVPSAVHGRRRHELAVRTLNGL